ncbi:MAG: Uma2 family endonuclease [Chloroflexota bacterium]|jgi:Uma2 family endonuclease|nr:Uma2 family endonuclease [Chloroflexota bacterium]
MDILELAHRAENAGVKLELVGGLPMWEAFPSYKHQKIIDQIRRSLPQNSDENATGCACIHISDAYILFPDGSLKRPDIAIFCQEPPEAEQETAISLIPEAIIEVVSKGYEAKDLQIGPRFYLMHGVKDVIVHDPFTQTVLHMRRDGTKYAISPTVIALACGCNVTV